MALANNVNKAKLDKEPMEVTHSTINYTTNDGFSDSAEHNLPKNDELKRQEEDVAEAGFENPAYTDTDTELDTENDKQTYIDVTIQ